MKNTKLFAAAAMMAFALAMTGCSSSSSTAVFDIASEKEGEAVFENAEKGTELSSGALLIADGEQLVIEPKLEEGEVMVQLQNSEGETEENPVTFDSPELEVTVLGTEAAQYDLTPGEYNVRIVVNKKTNGSIHMSVKGAEGGAETAQAEAASAQSESGEAAPADAAPAQSESGEPAEPNNWTEASTAEEAAKGAGFDSMAEMNGVKISLGEIGTMGDVKYRYMDGIVQAFFSGGAVEMSVVKGRVPAGDGDVSFDDTAYAYTWTQDVDGQEVQCFGNREGDATKTIWTDGEYNYAVLAYGAGGDDDYGLRSEDVAIMVKELMK